MAYNAKTKMYEGYIYCVTNIKNNMKYIGQTSTTIKNRWSQHKNDMKHSNLYFYNALNYFGIENFVVDELLNISCELKSNLTYKLNVLEIEMISQYQTLCPLGYNIALGGDNCGKLPQPVSQYDKHGILINTYESITEAGDILNLSCSQITSNCRGGVMTCGGWVFRYKNDDFNKYKIVSTHKKRVKMYKTDGEFIRMYNSMLDAAIDIGENIDSVNLISHVCRGKCNTFKGFVFRYEFDEFDKYEFKNRFSKKVNQYDMDGNFIKTFDSIKSVSDTYNVYSSNIVSCCKNKSISSCGFRWKYFTDNSQLKEIKDKNESKYIAVCKYSMDGELLETYKSVSDAAKSINKSTSAVSGVCKGKEKSIGGFIFRYQGDEFNKYKFKGYLKKPVIQYSLSNDFICKYDSIKEASIITKANESSIGACCKGKQESSCGFIWKYVDDNI